MNYPIENKNFYVSQTQREVLLHLITYPLIGNKFFLTGGTALSVFYLYHRLSNALDFFTIEMIELGEIDFWVRQMWQRETIKIKESQNFLSFLIKETKVDFVVDSLSSKDIRKKVSFENNHHLAIDTIDNIASNKLCTVVSRVEPKDFIDFYFIKKNFSSIPIERLYNNAKEKDAIFDDPPTAAFQLEEGINFLKDNPAIFPQILLKFEEKDFFEFYDNLAKWLYQLVKIT